MLPMPENHETGPFEAIDAKVFVQNNRNLPPKKTLYGWCEWGWLKNKIWNAHPSLFPDVKLIMEEINTGVERIPIVEAETPDHATEAAIFFNMLFAKELELHKNNSQLAEKL
jgi:hypothetical protein